MRPREENIELTRLDCVRKQLRLLGPVPTDPFVKLLFPDHIEEDSDAENEGEPSPKQQKMKTDDTMEVDGKQEPIETTTSDVVMNCLDTLLLECKDLESVMLELNPSTDFRSDKLSNESFSRLMELLCSPSENLSERTSELFIFSVLLPHLLTQEGVIGELELDQCLVRHPAHRERMIDDLLSSGHPVAGGMVVHLELQGQLRVLLNILTKAKVDKESLVLVTTIIATSPHVLDTESDLADAFSMFLNTGSSELLGCVKFSKLLLQVLGKVRLVNSSTQDNFRKIVASNKTFLRKRLEQELDKIKCLP